MMRVGVSALALAALSSALIAAPAAARERAPAAWAVGNTVTGAVIQVIDGDTLRVQGDGGIADVRLHGIDAPEYDQRCTSAAGAEFFCGQEAARQLATLLGTPAASCPSARMHGVCVSGTGVPVKCEVLGYDRRWQRPVARCFSGPTDLGREMVQRGYARSAYSHDYDLLALSARMQSRGLWSGTWVDPASYRRQAGAK